MRAVVIIVIYVAVTCTQTKNPELADTIAQEQQVIQSDTSVQSTWDSIKVEKLDIIGFYPQFTTDGESLVYSTQTYDGLWICDLKSQLVRQLTNEKGAGYMPKILDDKIIYQVRTRLKYLEEVQLSTGTISRVDDGQSRLTPNEYVIQKEALSEKKNLSVQLSMDLLSIEIRQNNGTVKSIVPLGKKNYLNPSLSPNQLMILFEVSGLGGYIADLSGNIIEELGDIDAPVWVGNDKILYAVSKDDGEQTLSSEVFIYSVDSKKEYHLTIEMDNQVGNPQANMAGDEIVVNSPDGKIFILKRK